MTPIVSEAKEKSYQTAPHPSLFSGSSEDTDIQILTYLNERELLIVNIANRFFCSLINKIYQIKLKQRGLIPERRGCIPDQQSPAKDYKQLFNQFRNATDMKFYQTFFGEVENVPPIPRNYVEHPRAGFRLVYHPESVTISAGADSPLVLDQRTAIDNKHGARLVEDPTQALKVERKIEVPWTINNKILLFQKYLKKARPLQFGGTSAFSFSLNQNGDVVTPAHWSYQTGETLEPYQPPQKQNQMAQQKGLEVVSLQDKIDFDLSSYFQLGISPLSTHFARTSTVIIDKGNFLWPSIIGWSGSSPFFYLDINTYFDFSAPGVAVGVPSENSST